MYLDEVSNGTVPSAACLQHRAFLFAGFNQPQNFVEHLLVDLRSLIGLGVKWITDLSFRCQFFRMLHEFVVYLGMNESPRCRYAHLAGIEENCVVSLQCSLGH